MMKLCTTCGNEIDDCAWLCPFCEHQQHGASAPRERQGRRVATVNLKKDLPSVDEAMDKLEQQLVSLKHQRVGVVRLVHGWGSSGTGGIIKAACHRHLAAKARRKDDD